MKKCALLFALCLGYVSMMSGQQPDSDIENNWHQWRGPYENGVSPKGDPPINWSETKNIKWKKSIPGTGHATPIVWKNQIILLTAIPTDKKGTPGNKEEGAGNADWMNPTSTDLIHRFAVISVDRTSGEIMWETTVREELPSSHTHEFGSWASHSPVTDGERIYAYFGSHGLYCLDLSGEIRWERDLGVMQKRMSFGEGSSPYLYKDKLIVLRDHEGPSMLHVLDKTSGETLWETDRDERSSWSTPSVIEFQGTIQLLTSATNRVCAYDLNTGEILWHCTGLTGNVIPSPLVEKGILYVMSGFRGSAMFAIDLSKAKGDINGTDAILWSHHKDTPYTPNPVLVDNKLYFLRVNNGFLSCFNALDGSPYYETEKLDGIGNIFTSPVAAAGRIYVIGTKGTSCVINQGEEFDLLSKNTLDDNFYASPVVLGDELFLRGVESLYCIAED